MEKKGKTMTDYIKREDALELISKCISYTLPEAKVIDFRHGEMNGLNWAGDIIEAMPSADVEPVRHGKWEATEWAVNRSGAILIGRLYRCSECGRIIDLEHGETFDDYPYCHCGAKMNGEVIKNE